MYKVAKVVKVVDVYHRRSPLVQGGLELVGDGANWPSRNMKLWFKRNTRNLSMVNLKMSQLLSLEILDLRWSWRGGAS